MTLKMKQEFKMEKFKRELRELQFSPKNKETLLSYVQQELYQIFLLKNKPDFDNILEHDFLKLPPQLELQYALKKQKAQNMKFDELKAYLLELIETYYADYNNAYPNAK